MMKNNAETTPPGKPKRRWKRLTCGCLLLPILCLVLLRLAAGIFLSGTAFQQPELDAAQAMVLDMKIRKIEHFYKQKRSNSLLSMFSSPEANLLETTEISESEINSYLHQQIEERVPPELRQGLSKLAVNLEKDSFLIQAELGVTRGLTGMTTLPWPLELSARLDVVGRLEWLANLGQAKLVIDRISLGWIDLTAQQVLEIVRSFQELPPGVDSVLEGVPVFGLKNIKMEEGKVVLEGR